MGKKSFALMKEILKKQLGRYPTRAELFKECYYKADGSSTSLDIEEAIEKMQEVAADDVQNLNDSAVIHDLNDSFAKIMGKDKDGQLRMYGIGVTANDVYGGKPSRASLLRQAMEYKEKYLSEVKKYETLNTKLENLAAYVHGRAGSFRQPDAESAPLASPNERVESQNPPTVSLNGQSRSRSPPLASPNNNISSASNSCGMHIKVGSYVVLKSLANINEIVATGIVNEIGGVRVSGMELGPEFCQVIVQCQMKKDTRLLFPHGLIQTIGDALGAPVAWPLSLVTLDEDEI